MLNDCEAEIVICRQSIHDEASLIPSRNSIDHGTSIRRSVPTRKFVETGCVISTSIYATELSSNR
jgi:hypothetical protein